MGELLKPARSRHRSLSGVTRWHQRDVQLPKSLDLGDAEATVRQLLCQFHDRQVGTKGPSTGARGMPPEQIVSELCDSVDADGTGIINYCKLRRSDFEGFLKRRRMLALARFVERMSVLLEPMNRRPFRFILFLEEEVQPGKSGQTLLARNSRSGGIVAELMKLVATLSEEKHPFSDEEYGVFSDVGFGDVRDWSEVLERSALLDPEEVGRLLSSIQVAFQLPGSKKGSMQSTSLPMAVAAGVASKALMELRS
jgi:hypothetical protein